MGPTDLASGTLVTLKALKSSRTCKLPGPEVDFLMTRLPKNGLAGAAVEVEATWGVEASEGRADSEGVATEAAGLPLAGPGAAAAGAAGVKVLDAPPGVKLAAFGLKGLKELAFALSLKDEVLTEEEIPPSALAAVAASPALAACRALNLSGLKGGILGMVIFCNIALLSASF